tara:strand:- start:572 stop:1276 length:705 start_codon:yes stop_codon:yes gene_type:complete
MKIKEITIALLCGHDKDRVSSQKKDLIKLEDEFTVKWNNRIDRHPFAYDSYSELINTTIETSQTEVIITINDRAIPTVDEVKKIISHLESGFACSFMYGMGFMGFTKSLIKKIGWMDQRFLNGGWEDVDWIYRLKLNNLALYESRESNYDFKISPSPLQIFDVCRESQAHFINKYKEYDNYVIKELKEISYNYTLPEANINWPWKPWSESILGVSHTNIGPFSERIRNKKIIEV